MGTLGILARRAKATGRKRGPYQRRDIERIEPANPVAVAVLRFLALSGWREGEALTLRRDAIDAERGVAVLVDTKTGRSVRPLGKAALAVLTATISSYGTRGNPYVFIGAKAGEHLFSDRVALDHSGAFLVPLVVLYDATAGAPDPATLPNGAGVKFLLPDNGRDRERTAKLQRLGPRP